MSAMPSDEECREVAVKLRDFETLRQVFKESSICAFLDVFNDGHMDWEHICARLADLIEPEERTCRVVTEMRALSQTQDKHTKSCSSCGYVFGSEEHRQLLPGLGERVAINPVVIPNFCPKCGAKVVEE